MRSAKYYLYTLFISFLFLFFFNIFYDVKIGKAGYFFHRFFPNKVFLNMPLGRIFLPYYFQADKINSFDILFFGSSITMRGVDIPKYLNSKVLKITGANMYIERYPNLYTELLPKINVKTYEIVPMHISLMPREMYYKSDFIRNLFLFFNFQRINRYRLFLAKKIFHHTPKKVANSSKNIVPMVREELYFEADTPYDYITSINEFFARERALNIKEAFTYPETYEMYFYYDLERLYFLFKIYASFRSFYMYDYPSIKTRAIYQDFIHFEPSLGKEYINFYEHGYSKYFTKVTKENLDSFFIKKYKNSLKTIPIVYGRKDFDYTWTKAVSINEKFFTKNKKSLLNKITSNNSMKFDEKGTKSFDLGKLDLKPSNLYMLSVYGDFKQVKVSFFVKKAGGKKVLLTSFDKPLQKDLFLYLPSHYNGYNVLMEVKSPKRALKCSLISIDIREVKKDISIPKIDQDAIDFYTKKSKLLMEGGYIKFGKFYQSMYDKYSNSMLANTKKQKLFFTIPKYSKHKEYMVRFAIKGELIKPDVILKSDAYKKQKLFSKVFKAYKSGYNIYFNIPKNSSKNGKFYFEISAKNNYKPNIELKEKWKDDI